MSARGFFGYSQEEHDAGIDAVEDAWEKEKALYSKTSKCLVPFCRKSCSVLPEYVEVRRSGLVVCPQCERTYDKHQSYAYSTGMKHVHLGCDGVFYHL